MINFPVKVGVSSAVVTYAASLTSGQKQLLICSDSKELFLTNGDGTFTKMVTGTGEGGSGLTQVEVEALLADYLKTDELASHLTGFVTDENLTTKLNDYLLKSELETEVESAVSTALESALAEAVVKEAGKLTGLEATAEEIQGAVTKAHEHANASELAKITESEDGKILYNGKPLLESVDATALTLEIATLDTF